MTGSYAVPVGDQRVHEPQHTASIHEVLVEQEFVALAKCGIWTCDNERVEFGLAQRTAFDPLTEGIYPTVKLDIDEVNCFGEGVGEVCRLDGLPTAMALEDAHYRTTLAHAQPHGLSEIELHLVDRILHHHLIGLHGFGTQKLDRVINALNSDHGTRPDILERCYSVLLGTRPS